VDANYLVGPRSILAFLPDVGTLRRCRREPIGDASQQVEDFSAAI